jgi:hypothetical protein
LRRADIIVFLVLVSFASPSRIVDTLVPPVVAPTTAQMASKAVLAVGSLHNFVFVFGIDPGVSKGTMDPVTNHNAPTRPGLG